MNEIDNLAVDKFLLSIDIQQPLVFHLINLDLEADKFEWNSVTRLEILRHLFKMFGKVEAIHA